MKPNEKDVASWIAKAGKTERIKEFPYPYLEGFFVQIAFASRFILKQIRQASIQEFTDRRTRTREERLLDEKLNLGYAERIVKGWRGLTVKKLDNLIPGSFEEAIFQYEEEKKKNPETKTITPEEIGKMEVQYSVETAMEILTNSTDFSLWILDISGNSDSYSSVGARKKEQYDNLQK